MWIYLAARYSRRDEMRAVASQLRARGHIITSRWLDTDWEIAEKGSSAAPPALRQEFAEKDLSDVRACELCISFTEEPHSDGRGGRHVEFGFALALGKKLVIVGHRENIFHHLKGILFYDTTSEMLEAMTDSPGGKESTP